MKRPAVLHSGVLAVVAVLGVWLACIDTTYAKDAYWRLDTSGRSDEAMLASSSGRAPAGAKRTGNSTEVPSPQGQDKDFDVEAALYAWVINTAGSVRRGSVRISMNASFLDYLRLSDEFGIFMGKVEARYRRFGFYVDFVRATNGINIDTPAFDLAGRLAVPRLTGKFTVIQVFADFVGFYRFHDSKSDGHTGIFGSRRVTMDALAGLRYSRQSIKLALSANGPLEFRLGPIVVRRTLPDARIASTTERIDPVIGFRLGVQASRKIHVTVRGDVGGFGVGSEFTWNAVALIRYQVPVWGYPVNLLFGYRALFQHTVDGAGSSKITSTVTQHGPLLGVSVRF